MVVIVQSTAVVQASGVAATTTQVQIIGATTVGSLVQQDVVLTSNIIDQFGGITAANEIIQFTGAAQDTHIVNPTLIETTADAEFIIFPKSFSRGAFLAAVVGTTGTIEHFFDRSPFFFTPSETDPNTLRDISEAQQFLVFSQTKILNFDPYRNTPQTTTIITDKGSEINADTEKVDAVINGNFALGVSGWTTTSSGTSAFIPLTGDFSGAGFPVTHSPQDGERMLRVRARLPNPSMTLWQEFDFTQASIDSNKLDKFSFALAVDTTSVEFQANLLFFLDDEQTGNLRYRISNLSAPGELPSTVTQIPIEPVSLSSISTSEFPTYIRNIHEDFNFTSFKFNRLQVWFIFDENSNTGDFLIDAVALTLDLPQDQLLSTSSAAHVNTAHPVSSEQFGLDIPPLTISGSDNITQVDLSPPFFAETNPASGTRNVPETTNLEFHIQDVSSAIDQGTINVFVNNDQIITAGTTITGSNYPVAFKTVLATNDIEYIFQPAAGVFVPGEDVTVTGTFADLAAVSNLGIGNYEFTIVGSGSLGATISGSPDADPPIIIPTEPVDSDTDISSDTQVLWTLTDNASGVDPSTVRLLLNGAVKLQNDVAVEGLFSRVTNTSRGFDYTYTPANAFQFGETVTGTIFASDNKGNSDSLEYSFTITSSDTLEIENFFLGLNQTELLTSGTIVSVDVVDETFGVASGTTTFTINGQTPVGLSTTVSGGLPSRLTFEVPLEALVDFREDLVVFVHAENQFPGAFPVVKEQQFTLRTGYDVKWPNRTEDVVSGPEVTFPYITNIEVLTDVKNFAKNFGESSAFFRFLTENQATSNLGATITSNIATADLPAVMGSLNPFFEYGKTMTLEIEADDLVGNEFRLTHTFVIEDAPT